jgi:hypothetical protein
VVFAPSLGTEFKLTRESHGAPDRPKLGLDERDAQVLSNGRRNGNGASIPPCVVVSMRRAGRRRSAGVAVLRVMQCMLVRRSGAGGMGRRRIVPFMAVILAVARGRHEQQRNQPEQTGAME